MNTSWTMSLRRLRNLTSSLLLTLTTTHRNSNNGSKRMCRDLTPNRLDGIVKITIGNSSLRKVHSTILIRKTDYLLVQAHEVKSSSIEGTLIDPSVSCWNSLPLNDPREPEIHAIERTECQCQRFLQRRGKLNSTLRTLLFSQPKRTQTTCTRRATKGLNLNTVKARIQVRTTHKSSVDAPQN